MIKKHRFTWKAMLFAGMLALLTLTAWGAMAETAYAAGEVTVTIGEKSITLSGETNETGEIVVAFYGEDDRLLDFELSSAAEGTFQVEPVEAASCARVMWWESLSTLKPVCAVETVDLSDLNEEIIYGYIKSVNHYTDAQMASTSFSFNGGEYEAITSVELSNGVSYAFTEEEARAVKLYCFTDGSEPKFTDSSSYYNSIDLSDSWEEVNVYMPVKVAVSEGKITKIGFFGYFKKGIVTEVSNTSISATADGLKGSDKSLCYTLLDKAKSVSVILDGNAGASLADITEGMYVMGASWLEDGADKMSYHLLVSSERVTGTLSEISNGAVTVSDEAIRFASANVLVSADGGDSYTKESVSGANLGSLLLSEVTVVKNPAGRAVTVTGTSTVYGLVDSVEITDEGSTLSLFVAKDGAVSKESYPLASENTVDTDAVLASARSTIGEDNETYPTEADKLRAYAEKGFVKVTLNENKEIKGIEQFVGLYAVGGEKADYVEGGESVVYKITNSAITYMDSSWSPYALIQSGTKFFDIKDCFGDAGAPTLVELGELVGKVYTDSFGISMIKSGDNLLAGILTNGAELADAETTAKIEVKFGMVSVVSDTGDMILLTGEGLFQKEVEADSVPSNQGDIIAYEEVSDASIKVLGIGDPTATELTTFAELDNGKEIDFKEVTLTVDSAMLNKLDLYNYEILPVGGDLYAGALDTVVFWYNQNTEKYVVRDLYSLSEGDEAYIVVNDYDKQYVMIVIN